MSDVTTLDETVEALCGDLSRIRARYGVDPSVIIAIYGKGGIGKSFTLGAAKKRAQTLLGVTKSFDGDKCGYFH